MDIWDILDLVIDPVVDLALCKGKLGIWGQKRVVSFLLTAGSVLFLMILLFAIRSGSVAWTVVGAIGAGSFSVLDCCYTVWWIRKGRHGADLPLIDEIQIPAGDLNSKLTQEEKLRIDMTARNR